jgi:MPN domain-containing protein
LIDFLKNLSLNVSTFTEEEEEKNMEPPPPPPKRFVVPHNTIINRHIPHDSNTLIEAVDFAALGKIQPFLVTITTSAALLIDFHCHLTKNEVCGYLGGTWDVNSHSECWK